jgi:hypothetical protein
MLGKGWFLSARLRFWFWVLSFFVDGLPLFNTLPTSSLLVLYAWRLTKKRAADGSTKLKRLNSLTRRSVRRLNQAMYTVESEN